MNEGDLGARLLRQRQRGLHRAVPAAHHGHALSGVCGGIRQAVDHVRQGVAWHAQAARRAAATDGQDHAVRGQRARRGDDAKAAARCGDGGDLGALDHLELGARDDLGEQLQQGLLAGAAQPELADARQLERRGHHDLLPRVALDRAAELALLQHHAARAPVLGLERGPQARRAGADDQQVVVAAVSASGRERGAGRLLALLHGVVDEPDAGELAGDIQPGDRGLERAGDDRHLDAALRRAEHQLDGGHRTAPQAVGVAHARGGADQLRAPGDDGDDLALRAGVDARAAADARLAVDLGIQRWRRRGLGCQLGGDPPCPGGALERRRRGEHSDRGEQADGGEVAHAARPSRDARRAARALIWLAQDGAPAGGGVAVIAGDLHGVVRGLRAVEGVTGDAVGPDAGPVGVAVAAAAARDPMAADQRIRGEVVVKADDSPAIAAVAVQAIEGVAGPVRVAVAGAAGGVDRRSLTSVVAGQAR